LTEKERESKMADDFTRGELLAAKEERNAVNMDAYFSRIPAVATIPLVEVPLAAREGAALLRSSTVAPAILAKYPPVSDDCSDQELLDSHEEDLASVRRALEAAVVREGLVKEGSGDSGDGFFVKSFRSPKDVTAEAERTRGLFFERLEAARAGNDGSDEPLSRNTMLLALYEAQIEALRVRSVSEALDLLLASQRVAFDLALDLHFFTLDVEAASAQPEAERFTQALFVRPWFASITPQSEFRVFVAKGRTTAISQYYTQVYFPLLDSRREDVTKRILSFAKEMIAHLEPLRTYVLDISLDVRAADPPDSWDARVIELNPLHPSTGAGLFSWEDDADLLEGLRPGARFADAEVRILDAPPEVLESDLFPAWRRWLAEAVAAESART
jgi:D123